jgi:outer membrane receptor protein involved in Fe transport
VAAIVAASIAGKLPVAAAQQQSEPPAPAPAGEPVQKLEEVTVTGSRIKRTTDYTTPTPTTVIDSTVLDNLGIVNLGQALNQIPSNLSQMTPGNTANSAFFTGSYLADLRGLNPFFGSRTLTLIDTRRAVQTNQGDGFDLNMIPQILVQRIDTVTGGASAAYGSGAISGVVNIFLDHKLEGARINADGYESNHSDGKDRHIGAAYGHGILDDRIHFVVGGEFEHQDEIGCQQARTWCAADKGWYQNGMAGAAPTYAAGTGLRAGVVSPAGTFFPVSQGFFGLGATSLPQGNAGSTYQVTPDGTGLMPYSIGYAGNAGETDTGTFIGGNGPPQNQFTALLPNLSRGVITAMVTAKITDDINFKGDWNWGQVRTSHDFGGSTSFGSGLNITPQNAYLTPGIIAGEPTLAPGGAPGVMGAEFSKQWMNVDQSINTSTTVKRFSVGFDGKVPGTSWNWDAYFEYGNTRREQFEPGVIRASSYAMAVDSVLANPLTGQAGAGAQPMCRVTAAALAAGDTNYIADVTNPANPWFDPFAGYATNPTTLANNNALASGCVPINPFGINTVPSDAQAYSFGALDEKLRYSQTVAAINAAGNIFKGIGGGPFALAVGVEWRQEQGFNDEIPSCLPSDVGVTGAGATASSCTLRSQDFAIQFGTPFAGGVKVDEVYGELALPLARNLPFAHGAEIDFSGRFSRYDNNQILALEPQCGTCQSVVGQSGETAKHNLVTYKVQGFYEPIEGVRIRASDSHDSRAANFRELYYGQQLKPFSQGGFAFCGHPGADSFLKEIEYDGTCFWNLLGNVSLAPETSDTQTFGIVLTPPQLPGLNLAADYFHIKINNSISQASVNQVELACNSMSAACAGLSFDNNVWDIGGTTMGPGAHACYVGAFGPFASPADAGCGPTPVAGTAAPDGGRLESGKQAWVDGAANVAGVNSRSYNGSFYTEDGIDLTLTYTQSLPDNSLLTFRSLATWTGLQRYQAYQGLPALDILGQVGGIGILGDFTPAPRWAGNASITWTKGVFSMTPNMRWVGTGKLNALGVTPGPNDKTITCPGPDLYQRVACGDPSATTSAGGYVLMPYNHVGSYFLFGLNSTLSFEDKLGIKTVQVFAQVDNLFNRAPPFAAAPGSFFGSGTAGANPILYDTIGMATRIGFRLIF